MSLPTSMIWMNRILDTQALMTALLDDAADNATIVLGTCYMAGYNAALQDIGVLLASVRASGMAQITGCVAELARKKGTDG